MKNQNHSIRTMLRLHVIGEQLKRLERTVFEPQEMTDSEMETFRDACQEVLDGEDKGLATRAELFALYYYCQPGNIFRTVSKNSTTVKTYASRYLGMDKRLLSYYRGTIAFLYFNDIEFQSVANVTVDAVRAAMFDDGREAESDDGDG